MSRKNKSAPALAASAKSAAAASETTSEPAGQSVRVWPILLLAACLFVIFRSQAVHVPLERDEGEYAYIAQRMLQGEVPYRDIFDQKPPGVFVAYLLPVWLCGTSVAAIHILAYVWTAGTAVMLFLLARDLVGVRAAALAQVFFAVLTVCPEWQALAANTELFMLLPMTAAAWCVSRALALERTEPARKSGSWWLAAGVLSMLAAMFKQVAITNVGFLAVWVWLASRERKPERPIRDLLPAAAWFATGMLAIAIIVGMIFVLLGSGREFFDCVVWHNVRYSQNHGWRDGKAALWDMLGVQVGTFWGVWLLTVLALIDLRRGRRQFTALLASWLLFSAAGVSVGFYFREHYFIQLAPAFALACGVTLDRWVPRGSEKLSALQASLLATLVAVVCSLPWLMPNLDFWFQSNADWKARLMYSANPFPESAEIAGHLRRLSDPEDTVLIYGSEPQMLFLAERRSATRYILFYPLMMGLPGGLERQQEAIRDIVASRPKVILQTNLRTSLLQAPSAPRYFHEELNKLIRKSEYTLVGFRAYDMSTRRSELLFPEDAEKELDRRLDAEDLMKSEGRSSPFLYDMLVFVRN